MYQKTQVINNIWQYSKYLGNLLSYCFNMEQDKQGHALLIYLFNVTELIFKSTVENYDCNFSHAIKTLRQNNKIDNIEYDFLNNNQMGIRKFRNLLAHANLSKYNVVFPNEHTQILFPLTENETCLKLYNLFSDILFNLILKTITQVNINLHENINAINIKIEIISADQLLEYKGFDSNYINKINKLENITEDTKYRLAENSTDIDVLAHIFRGLLN